MYNIYTLEIVYTAFTLERWSTPHLVTRYGEYSIYSRHFLMSDGVHFIYPMTDGVQGIYL